MNRAIFLVLLFSAAHAAAQSAAPQQTPPPERKAPAGETRLNLKLDQPARFYVRETTPEGADGKAAAGNLPSLGGGAATLERPSEPRVRTPTSPYPQDSENPR